MRVTPPVAIDEATRRELEHLSRKRSIAARALVRGGIVLLAGDGMQNQQIAERLDIRS